MVTLTSSEVSSIAMSLTLRWLAMRSAEPVSSWTSTGRQYTPADAIRLATRFAPSSSDSHHSDGSRLSERGRQILRTLDVLNDEIDRYEDERLQQLALDLIPFDGLHSKAEDLSSQGCQKSPIQKLAFQDALAQVLVEWAKRDFLRWVDPIRCSSCQSETEGIGHGTPTQDERDAGGAGRVELYRCTRIECQGRVTRFPRYTNLDKLLQTRMGRCGEFAAIFTLLLRALGLRARYVWNSEDHVWNEYYSDDLKRWVHIDSCEGARGKELLYNLGWGKKMKYCMAFGVSGASDVTRAYVSDWPSALARRDQVPEDALEGKLRQITEERRASLPSADRDELASEDLAEEQWLQSSTIRLEAAQQETLSGRTSGTKEWRQQRSELGSAGRSAEPALAAGLQIASLGSSETTCNGSARAFQEGIQLTADKPDQTGSVFLSLPVEASDNFIVTFSFVMTSSSDNGADGMAFVLHSAPDGCAALGRGGCDLGYGDIPSSIAIELDTYRSQDRCDDPPVPHVSIHSRGTAGNEAHHRSSLWCTRPGALPELADGSTYTLKLEFSDGARKLRIWFTDSKDGEGFEELTDGAVSLPDCLSGRRYVGWTASTGGLHQSHTILGFKIFRAEPLASDTVVPS